MTERDLHENATGMLPPGGVPGSRTVPGAIFTGFVAARDEMNRKRMLKGQPAFTDMSPTDLLGLAESMLAAGRQSVWGGTYDQIESVGAVLVAAAQARLREDELRIDLGGDAA